MPNETIKEKNMALDVEKSALARLRACLSRFSGSEI
jgi:hypothetical protein